MQGDRWLISSSGHAGSPMSRLIGLPGGRVGGARDSRNRTWIFCKFSSTARLANAQRRSSDPSIFHPSTGKESGVANDRVLSVQTPRRELGYLMGKLARVRHASLTSDGWPEWQRRQRCPPENQCRDGDCYGVLFFFFRIIKIYTCWYFGKSLYGASRRVLPSIYKKKNTKKVSKIMTRYIKFWSCITYFFQYIQYISIVLYEYIFFLFLPLDVINIIMVIVN